jgi:glycosyltransferase involved in cell wall biosynthesis
MLFARAIRERYLDAEIEVWRPERTVSDTVVWTDDDQVTHRIYPSLYLRYNLELSVPMLKAIRREVRNPKARFWVHGIYNLHAYLAAHILRDAPVIAQSHGGYPARQMYQISRHRWLRYAYLPLAMVERLCLRHYREVFAISSTEADYLRSLCSESGSNISMSPTGVDFDMFCPGDRLSARDSLGLDETGDIALFVGRLTRDKGLEVLIDACAIAVRKRPELALYIVGSGPLMDTLQDYVVRRDISEHVHLVGYVRPKFLPYWYRAANVTVVPSSIEWFGKISVESMACGTPVIITAGGASDDLIGAFGAGQVVPPDAPDTLADALCDAFSGGPASRPDVNSGREAFDWSAKLSRAMTAFEQMAR